MSTYVGTMLKITFGSDPWGSFLKTVKELGVEDPNTFYYVCKDDADMMEHIETFNGLPVVTNVEIVYLEE